MLDKIYQDAEQRMKKCVESFMTELSKLRTGRAHTSLLDHIKVSYYGNETPLNQVASITVTDARTFTITPWDKGAVQAIEKAIQTSDLGLNPSTSGNVIRVPLPSLTQERRNEFVKMVRGESEDARVSIRNARRDALTQVKELLKGKKISEDEEKSSETKVQQLTDKFIAEVEKLTQNKEQELMQI